MSSSRLTSSSPNQRRQLYLSPVSSDPEVTTVFVPLPVAVSSSLSPEPAGTVELHWDEPNCKLDLLWQDAALKSRLAQANGAGSGVTRVGDTRRQTDDVTLFSILKKLTTFF